MAVVQHMFDGVGVGGIIGDVLTVGLPTIKDVSEKGPVKGVLTNLSSTIQWAAMGGGLKQGFIYAGAQMAVSLFWENAKAQGEAEKETKNIGSGYVGSGYYNMSGAGYTMRQRAMQKMQGTAGNINQVFGNEARNYVGESRARGSVI